MKVEKYLNVFTMIACELYHQLCVASIITASHWSKDMHLAILPDSLIKYLISDLLEIVKSLPSGDNLNWFNTWVYAAYMS